MNIVVLDGFTMHLGAELWDQFKGFGELYLSHVKKNMIKAAIVKLGIYFLNMLIKLFDLISIKKKGIR